MPTGTGGRSLLFQIARAVFGDRNSDNGIGLGHGINLSIKPLRDAHHKAEVMGFQPQNEVRGRIAAIKEHQIGDVR